MTGMQDISARLRHRITIERPDMTAEDGGQFSMAWEVVGMAWAMIDPIPRRGSEGLFAEQEYAPVLHEITLRYRDDLTTQMRIIHEGREFNIRSMVNPGESKELLRILAEENVAN